MMVVDLDKSEVGQQRKRMPDGRLLHACCVCGLVDLWDDRWSWYGSYRDIDAGESVAKCCSDKCREKAGENARNVTADMIEAAHQREWRKPHTFYREATDREKFNMAIRKQRV